MYLSKKKKEWSIYQQGLFYQYEAAYHLALANDGFTLATSTGLNWNLTSISQVGVQVLLCK